MDCLTSVRLFIRANGNIYCGCNAGVELLLQPFDYGIDYSKDVLFGTEYQSIRNNLQKTDFLFLTGVQGACTFK